MDVPNYSLDSPGDSLIAVELNKVVEGMRSPDTENKIRAAKLLAKLCIEAAQTEAGSQALADYLEVITANDQIIEAEERYRSTVNSLPDMLFVLTRQEGKFIDCQASDSDPLLMERELFIGKTLSEVLPQDIAEKAIASIKEVFETGNLQIFEYSLDMPNGEQFFEMRMSVMNATECLAIVRNISDRKKLEEEVLLSNERLSLAVSANGVGIWDYNVTNNKLSWDEQMYDLYGIDGDHFTGAYEFWRNGLFTDDVQRGDEEIQMALRGEKDFDTEFRILWPDGSIHYIRALAHVQRDSSGKAIRMIGTNWDITNRKQTETKLQESFSRQEALISNISDVIGIMGIDGHMKYKSPNIEKWFGWKPEDLIGTDGWETVHPDDIERIKEAFNGLIVVDGSVKTVEYRYKCKDGSYKHIMLTATNCINNPAINGVLLNYHDITERIQAENRLRNKEEELRNLIEISPIAIEVFDKHGFVITTNTACSNMFGVEAIDKYGIIPIFNFSSISAENIAKLQQGETVRYESLFDFDKLKGYYPLDTSKTGILWLDIICTPIKYPDGSLKGYMLQMQNITDRKQLEQDKAKLIITDELTGIGNRRYFDNEIKRIENKGRKYPVSMISIDIRRFKEINDKFRHAEGDKVLKHVATRLKGSIRLEDRLARVGGDEFTIILPSTNETEAKYVVKRIEEELARFPYIIDNTIYPIILSIGVATATDRKDSLSDLHDKADEKMYEHKETQI